MQNKEFITSIKKWNPFQPWMELKKLPRDSSVLFVTMFVNRLGNMAFPFLILFLTTERKLTPAQAGLILALYGGCSIVAAFFSGMLADRIQPRSIMKFSLYATSAVVFLYPFVATFAGLLVMTILWAFASECFRPANLTLISEISGPDHKKLALCFHRLAVNLGMSMGPALGGFLAEYSFRSIFFFDAATTLLAAVLLQRVSYRRSAEKAIQSSEMQDIAALAKAQKRRAFHDFRFLTFLSGIILLMIVYFQHESTLAIFVVDELKLSSRHYGFLFTLNTLLIVFLEIPLNVWTSHWPHRLSLCIGGALYAVGFGLLFFATSYWFILMAAVIWSFGEMIESPAASAAVLDFAPPKRTGEYMGLMTMSYGLAFTLGPAIGTRIYQDLGSRSLWIFCFITGLLGIFVLRTVRPRSLHSK